MNSLAFLLLLASLEGTWLGTLDVGAQKLRIVLHLKQATHGDITGEAESPDQTSRRLPLSAVVVKEQSMSFSIGSIGASFEGTIEGPDRIAGTFKQGSVDLPLRFRRVTDTELRASAPSRPQIPVPPFPYTSREASIPNPSAEGVTLAGTLTIPKGDGPFPGIILITGSGPQTRDQSVAGHPLFLVLADYLTRKGVAVLRYDDRGTGKSAGQFASAVSRDFASDAVAAFEWLRKQPEVAGDKCGIFGHSEGGTVGTMAARKLAHVAFMVLLAPPAVRGSDLLLAQKDAILRAMGNDAPNLSADRAFYEALLAGKPEEELRSLGAKFVPESQVGAMLLSPWMRSFLTHDPAPDLEALRCPTLLLFGEKDLQVLPKQNEPVARALAKRNPHLTVEVLPGLNHLGQTATTGSPAEYSQIEETMAPLLMDRVAAYITQSVRTLANKSPVASAPAP